MLQPQDLVKPRALTLLPPVFLSMVASFYLLGVVLCLAAVLLVVAITAKLVNLINMADVLIGEAVAVVAAVVVAAVVMVAAVVVGVVVVSEDVVMVTGEVATVIIDIENAVVRPLIGW